MSVLSFVRGALVATALLLAGQARAQEEATAPPAADAAPDKPAKPKPRPRPKPRPDTNGAAKPRGAEPAQADAPELRTGGGDAPHTAASEPAPAAPSDGLAAPVVTCDPGQSVLYDGPKAFAVWVTRTGSVTIDNPLRPLTPDVTRVLQLVIGDKLATAYGRDLTALRRGAAPAALESLLGGPIRWDARLGSLPDALDIVSDAGAPLVQMRFKECGTAPVGKAPPAPVARKDGKARPSKKTPSPEQAGASPPASLARPASAAPQRQFNLPQGALGE